MMESELIFMRYKPLAAAILAVVLLLALSACGRNPSPAESGKPEPASRQTEQSAPGGETSVSGNTPAGEEETREEEPWKKALADDLFEKYGVLPEHYEDLGDGIYQVYVEVGGEILPFVTVDSATGDYHG